MGKARWFIIIAVIFSGFSIFSQIKTEVSKGVYRESKPGYYHQVILPSLNEDPLAVNGSVFVVDLKEEQFPTDPGKYTGTWHNAPVSQGRTGTCWCFATISMLESEIMRQKGLQVKLSEMFVVYWEYVERARAFVEERGKVYFAEGSEATSVIRMIQKHGIVPYDAYPGKEKAFHDHEAMFREMDVYLRSIAETNSWNIGLATSTIMDILNHYLGPPPVQFSYEGLTISPLDYAREVLGFAPMDFFSFMSTMNLVYNQKGELVEPDNWWHCDDYYNVTIEDFAWIIKNSLSEGYTVCICGDVSEPGFDRYSEVGVIPSFDIPAEYIDEHSREYRLSNGSTTDDHCMHIVGYLEEDGMDWYLVKDSGSGAFDGPNKGYRFIRDDYIRLKMMNIMVHKEGARKVLDKIIK